MTILNDNENNLSENGTDEDNLYIIKLWELNGSPIATFVKEIADEFKLVIHPQHGTILSCNKTSPYFEEITLRFVLNNQIIDANFLYYDDRQLLIRNVDGQRIRRINLKTIKEVQCNGQVYIPEWRK